MNLRLTTRNATKLPYRAIQKIFDHFILSYANKLILEIGLLDFIVSWKRINQ
jgi:hypothetical protein